MSTGRIEAGYGRVLILAMEHDFPAKMEEWKLLLREGKMTPEMREVFVAMGYPVPRVRAERKPRAAVEDVSAEAVAEREAEVVDSMHDSQPRLLQDQHDDGPDPFGPGTFGLPTGAGVDDESSSR